jgi:hypothetical protein
VPTRSKSSCARTCTSYSRVRRAFRRREGVGFRLMSDLNSKSPHKFFLRVQDEGLLLTVRMKAAGSTLLPSEAIRDRGD